MSEKSKAVRLHEKLGGKIEVRSKMDIQSMEDLSLVYTPGVASVCTEISISPQKVYELTMKKDTVAIVTDGSAVLGLGNIGPEAALPVMEGKAMIFKKFAGINAVPICLKTQNPSEIISIVKNISPGFAGINLEDISAPRCFEIEESLQDMGIPVFHDDQHGTAIVTLAALINALKMADKKPENLKVVISGAGAAGTSIAKLLVCFEYNRKICQPVGNVIVCDSKGIISTKRPDIVKNENKRNLAMITNKNGLTGTLKDAIKGADVFIGVSKADIVSQEMIKSMNDKAIVLAMANPTPEISPESAKKAGAFIVGTGRSDYPNQVNNALVFPGIFKGALEVKAKQITREMKVAAAYALAESVKHLSCEKILPNILDKDYVKSIVCSVKRVYEENLKK